MNDHKLPSRNSQLKGFHFGLQPTLAWSAILGFVFVLALGILAGAGSIMRLFFPVGAFAVSIFLYLRYPILYIGFTWWIWFLTPWVRRLIDYRSSFVEPSTVLLAPYLVTFVTIATFFRHLPKAHRQGGLPFVLCSLAVFYAAFIGLINSKFGDNSRVLNEIIGAQNFTYTPANVLRGLLDWLTPILFGFHLFVNWENYPKYRQNFQRIFLWGVLIMGAYGVVQYLVAPEWDRFWLTNVIKTGNTSFGLPKPLGIRVFSTMNSPGPFSSTMLAGLLLLLSGQGTLRFSAMSVGYLSFLLTLVRSAWGGWFVGLIIFISSVKSNLQLRLIITILVVGILAFPLTTIEPFSDVINSRLQTLTDVKNDASYEARTTTYNRALGAALVEPMGNGLGLPAVDSAIIDTLIAFGWLGCIPYVGGLILLLFKMMQCTERRFDTFMSSAFAITVSSLALLVLGNSLIAVGGLVLWGFLSMVLAGHRYYQHQPN